MKGSPVLTILGAALLLVGAGTILLGMYFSYSKTLYSESLMEMRQAQAKEMIGQSIVAKSLDYRQKNPKIEAILRAANVKHPALSNTTENPKPPGK